jgi:hypothetical protein
MMNDMRAIYTCDIGSIPQGNFGWARCAPEHETTPVGSTNISELANYLKRDIENGMNIAIGFECPLFLPVPYLEDDLCKGRQGEGNRAVFAPAGAAVATLGVHQVAWILRTIYPVGEYHIEFTTNPSMWPPFDKRQVLFCWEAFVSGDAHGDDHVRDAATATMFFIDNEMRLEAVNAVTTQQPLSLIHAVAIWAGWLTNVDRLHDSALVIKPDHSYEGTIIDIV